MTSLNNIQIQESKRTKCHFFSPVFESMVANFGGQIYAPGYACLNDAQVEIEENNIEWTSGAPGKITGSFWKPFCWDCMVATISNPEAIQGIRMVN
jgi:hypothetical protein